MNGSATGASLVFTADNWSDVQTVVVTAVDDQLAEGRGSVNLRHKVSSAVGDAADEIAGAYDRLTLRDVVVDVIDDDVAEVSADARGASQHAAIVEHGAADAGAEGQQQSIAAALGGAPHGLACECGLGVVVGRNGRIIGHQV